MHSRVLSLSSGHALLVLGGEFDLAVRSLVQSDVDEALHRAPRLIVDLSGVTFLDSTILSVLVWAQRRAADLGGEIILVDVPQPVLKLLVITQLDQVLTIRGTVADVLDDDPVATAGI